MTCPSPYPKRIVTERLVRNIQAAYQEGTTYRVIAKQYGLGEGTIRRIIKGDVKSVRSRCV